MHIINVSNNNNHSYLPLPPEKSFLYSHLFKNYPKRFKKSLTGSFSASCWKWNIIKFNNAVIVLSLLTSPKTRSVALSSAIGLHQEEKKDKSEENSDLISTICTVMLQSIKTQNKIRI